MRTSSLFLVLPSTCCSSVPTVTQSTSSFFFPFLPSLLHSKYLPFRFSHHLSFRSVLQGYPLEIRVTRLTGTEAAACVSLEGQPRNGRQLAKMQKKGGRAAGSPRRGVCFDVGRLRDFLGELRRVIDRRNRALRC